MAGKCLQSRAHFAPGARIDIGSTETPSHNDLSVIIFFKIQSLNLLLVSNSIFDLHVMLKLLFL
jgi:hypothetical protein